jgi:hypothetical protein
MEISGCPDLPDLLRIDGCPKFFKNFGFRGVEEIGGEAAGRKAATSLGWMMFLGKGALARSGAPVINGAL